LTKTQINKQNYISFLYGNKSNKKIEYEYNKKEIVSCYVEFRYIDEETTFENMYIKTYLEMPCNYNCSARGWQMDYKLLMVPKSIKILTNLINLDLSRNNITNIHIMIKSLSVLPSLELLDLSNNNITILPYNMYKLKNLKRLDLSCNKLKKISNIFKCKSLVRLSISGNYITHIPTNISKSNLLNLDMGNMQKTIKNYNSIIEQNPHIIFSHISFI
jgi:Leucine-rich repeat (LRR) protein